MSPDSARSALPAEVRRFQRDWHAEVFGQAWRLFQAGQGRKALELAAEAMRIKPDAARGWIGYGVILRESGEFARAVAAFRRALLLQPDDALAWSQLGEALRRRHQLEAALFCHQRALALQPAAARLHHRHALALASAGEDEAALAAVERAMALDPALAGAVRFRAERLGRLGDAAAGWGGDGTSEEAAAARLQTPPWRGEALEGRTLLVLAEGDGLGDPIWIARFFAPLKAQGCRLAVRCRRELHRLFSVSGVVDAVSEPKAPPPPHDLHVTARGLAARMAGSPAATPGAPYLRADPADAQRFARWRGLGGERLKVGLIWAGSVYPADAASRSVPLPALVESLDLPGVQLYALQKSAPSAAATGLQAGIEPAGMIDLGPLLEDLANTAAVLAELDLLITVDTAAAHLAGALGRPAWVLLNQPGHWLWGTDGEASRWYRSVRLLRAKVPGGWTEPLDRAAATLMRLSVERAGLARPAVEAVG